jgi:thiol:disulfide interchange protein DsbD
VSATVMLGNQVLKGPSVRWQRYSDQLLHNAALQDKPVIIDFSADWCAPCRELDQITFRHPDIVRLSQDELIFVKVDLTRSNNPVNNQLVDRFAVKGVPTIVFLDRTGQERKDLRQVDFVPPDDMLIRLVELQ